MSRSGYIEDMDDDLALGRYRGMVASTIRGKRGQAFLRELVESLDALPIKELIKNDLEKAGSVCAIGSVGLKRDLDMSKLDPEDPEGIAAAFGITDILVREIEFMNDEAWYGLNPHERWQHMRKWAVSQIKEPK